MSQIPLEISSTVRQDECELILARVLNDEVASIFFPQALGSSGAIGLDAMLTHVAVAQARRQRGLELVVPNDPVAAESYLDNLCVTGYGFAAMALADRVVDRLGNPKELAALRNRKRKRLEEIENLSGRIFLSQEGLNLPSIYGESSEKAKWMFSHSSITNKLEVQTPSQLQDWLSEKIVQILPAEFGERFDTDRRAALSTIAFELIENAAQHGRLNERAAPIRIGIRGLSIRLVDVAMEEASQISGGNARVNLYFARRIQRDRKKDSRFLEVTVFDSGIGFHRWLNAECNDNERTRPYRGRGVKETVHSCVFMHASSKGLDGTGVGLFRATRLLKDMFGFVRIRTGTECFFARLDQTAEGKDRVIGGDREDAESPHINLEEWYPHQQLADVGGTSVTFGMPLINWRKD